MTAKKGGLGRGFDSLFAENSVDARQTAELRLSQIVPNRAQPRKVFDDAALRELADSISRHGLIQPLLVRPTSDGTYQIVAGERRWRASRLAGLEKVPAVIREMSDSEAMEAAMIENLQREDLNPIEEAAGYQAMMDAFRLTQEEVAERVGKSRSAVANALRLLGLTDEESAALQNGEITSGHARALLSLTGELRAEGLRLAREGASVREIERLSKERKTGRPKAQYKTYTEIQVALAAEIGRKVKISGNGKRGTVQIEFFSDEDLFDIAQRLAGNK